MPESKLQSPLSLLATESSVSKWYTDLDLGSACTLKLSRPCLESVHWSDAEINGLEAVV